MASSVPYLKIPEPAPYLTDLRKKEDPSVKTIGCFDAIIKRLFSKPDTSKNDNDIRNLEQLGKRMSSL